MNREILFFLFSAGQFHRFRASKGGRGWLLRFHSAGHQRKRGEPINNSKKKNWGIRDYSTLLSVICHRVRKVKMTTMDPPDGVNSIVTGRYAGPNSAD